MPADDGLIDSFVDFDEQSTRKFNPRVVVGTTGLDHQAGQVNEEWLHQLQGRRGVRTYREMAENDSTAGGSLRIIKWVIGQVPWTVEANKAGGAEADACAQFLTECMADMQHSWASYISEVLSMMTFGWYTAMPIYKVRGGLATDDRNRHSNFDDNRIGWRALATRAQETLDSWEFDDEGNVLGWWQVAAPKFDRVFLPIDRLIHFRIDEHKNSPEGSSLLRPCFRPWFFLKRMQEIEAIGVERDMVGVPVAEVPEEMFSTPKNLPPNHPNAGAASKLASMRKLVERIQLNDTRGVVFPSEVTKDGKQSGYKLRLLTTGGSRTIDTSKPIERYARDIAQALMTQFQFLGMSGAGTQALSGNLMDFFAMGVSSIVDAIEETHHRFGTVTLLRLNGYPPEAFARIKAGEVSKQNVAVLSKAILDLTNAGWLTPTRKGEQKLRADFKLPELDEDEEAAADREVPGMLDDEADLLDRPRRGGGSTGGEVDPSEVE